MASIPVDMIANLFTKDLIDFVLKDHELPTLPPIPRSESAPSIPFDPSVSKVVIALIKEELRDDLLGHVCISSAFIRSYDIFSGFLSNYTQLFIQTYPCSYINILKLIGNIIMYSIFCYLSGKEFSLIYAYRTISDLFKRMDDGEFILRGKLSVLNYFASTLLEKQPRLVKMYERGTYPW